MRLRPFFVSAMYKSELRDAIANIEKVGEFLRVSVPTMRGFSIAYQPQANREGTIVGTEALLRWDPQCGHSIGPDVFVPVLEGSALILPVGQWVLTQALEQLVAFRARGINLHRISVNVSAQQLSGEFVGSVRDELDRLGLAPSDLALELTESQAVADSGRTSDAIRALADAGILLEIDDFGTGYASMRWIRKLRFGGIKLDRSLLIATDEPAGLIRGVCSMAHAIGMQVTAEGVETKEQRDRLLDDGVDYLQGYLIGRPVAAEQFPSKESLCPPPKPS